MAVNTVTIKQGDTKLAFKDTPKIDGVTMLPSDLVGCTLKFILKSATVLIKATGVINPDGTFEYDPVSADVAAVGNYQQEWELTFPSGKELTFPNTDYNAVNIIAELG
jgi:hypothetical protein